MTAATLPTGGAPAGSRVPRSGRRAGVVSALKYVTLVVGSFVTMIPILVVFTTSLKTEDEFREGAPFDAPDDWLNFENYATAFSDGGMATAFVNTTIILAVSLFGTIILGSMAAYAINRFEFKLKPLVLTLFLAATFMPGVTMQVATFQVVSDLGLFNSRWAAIALFTGTDIISIYIFLQFLNSIPRSLDEAALLDGASYFTIYRRIILPLMKPAIATVAIIKGVAIYNEFYIPFLYMPSRDLGVVSTSLFKFKGPFGTQWEIISAGVVITIIPSLIVFLLLQRFIYNNYMTGATK
ncbi:MAG: carbohydrate ABC transporter permease [Actinomycetota bacterium]|nr:carbohydrate ABC transporter permease [Actinomycetota bacterium]